MTATNHALTGAVIGMAIGNPWLAIPAALASHFVVDAIPHFSVGRTFGLGTKAFRFWLLGDALLCLALVAFLVRWQGAHWGLACICAFVAASPDFMWAKGFFVAQAGKVARHPKYLVARIHGKIQHELPLGLIVEAAWAFLCIVLLRGLRVMR